MSVLQAHREVVQQYSSLDLGTGVYHSFKTNYDVITGEIRRTTATVSTGETHGLLNYENVYMNVVSGLTTTVNRLSIMIIIEEWYLIPNHLPFVVELIPLH